jgi:CheY-like chemotaxis protein
MPGVRRAENGEAPDGDQRNHRTDKDVNARPEGSWLLRVQAFSGRMRGPWVVLRKERNQARDLMKILMTARDQERVAPLANGLESGGSVSLTRAGNGAEALSMARHTSPDLAVIADDLEDMSAFTLVAGLMAVNAMIHTVVLSDTEPGEFHAAGEGLGILVQLPSEPSFEDAQALLDLLTTVRGS